MNGLMRWCFETWHTRKRLQNSSRPRRHPIERSCGESWRSNSQLNVMERFQRYSNNASFLLLRSIVASYHQEATSTPSLLVTFDLQRYTEVPILSKRILEAETKLMYHIKIAVKTYAFGWTINNGARDRPGSCYLCEKKTAWWHVFAH